MVIGRVGVELWVQIPIALKPGGWAWGPWNPEGAVGEETVFSKAEVAAVIRAHGRCVGLIMQRRTLSDSYAVTAIGTTDHHVYGRAQWSWDQRAHEYLIDDEPWCPREIPMRQAIRSLALL